MANYLCLALGMSVGQKHSMSGSINNPSVPSILTSWLFKVSKEIVLDDSKEESKSGAKWREVETLLINSQTPALSLSSRKNSFSKQINNF